MDCDTVWDSQESLFGILNEERRVVAIEVVLFLSTLVYHRLGEETTQLHDIL